MPSVSHDYIKLEHLLKRRIQVREKNKHCVCMCLHAKWHFKSKTRVSQCGCTSCRIREGSFGFMTLAEAQPWLQVSDHTLPKSNRAIRAAFIRKNYQWSSSWEKSCLKLFPSIPYSLPRNLISQTLLHKIKKMEEKKQFVFAFVRFFFVFL